MTVKFKPTPEQRKTVRAMTAYGTPQTELAEILSIHPDTLRLHFARELAIAKAEANAKMAERLFNKGLGGDTVAMIFWMKTRGGWREPRDDPGDSAITIKVVGGLP